MSYYGMCVKDAGGQESMATKWFSIMFQGYKGSVTTAVHQTGMVLRPGKEQFPAGFPEEFSMADYHNKPYVAIRPTSDPCAFLYGYRTSVSTAWRGVVCASADGNATIHYMCVVPGNIPQKPDYGLLVQPMYDQYMFGEDNIPVTIVSANTATPSIAVGGVATGNNITVVNANTNYFYLTTPVEDFTPSIGMPVQTNSLPTVTTSTTGYAQYRHHFIMLKKIDATTIQVIPVLVRMATAPAMNEYEEYQHRPPIGVSLKYIVLELAA